MDDRVRPQIYVPVKLTTDLGVLSAEDRQLLPLLIGAAQIMDSLFWQEAWGAPDSIPLEHPTPEQRAFFRMNYGPWDRLDGDKAFLDGVGEKPKGARFYPADMAPAEFEAWDDSAKQSLYTMVRRDARGRLRAVPYHHYFGAQVQRAAALLDQAAALAKDQGLERYLTARAAALRTDHYHASDIAWMDMRTNAVDLIIGPIETYEDQLFGLKASHEAYVLVKDTGWTRRLERFAKLLPALQRGLPVGAAYKKETPGSDGQLGAYDVIYYAGACNAGGKTIAVNLPNDEGIQLQKGTRRLQLKNAMKAKFDRIVVPIAEQLVAEDQRKHVTFDAFFQNVMFHEVAHGLGIKNTINGKGTVREALLEEAGALEEGKADILGLYMVEELRRKGEIGEGELMDNYVTFMASVFRSVRFGASSAHGRANMVRFNFFMRAGAFMRDAATGTYRVDARKMHQAINDLSALILQLQGDGDLEGVQELMREQGALGKELQADLDRLKQADIPVDLVFEQGLGALGLGAAH
ncbi:MAG: Zn-dependent hydrolase [Flavobacteriales bacterium]|nr:Zn-dependent hydrolase [Flavobacteriales bacterium]MBP9081010.1 Zn-dependent hydrolase [Flavobacteriales bacterium]